VSLPRFGGHVDLVRYAASIMLSNSAGLL
jgi:hypothetical protein